MMNWQANDQYKSYTNSFLAQPLALCEDLARTKVVAIAADVWWLAIDRPERERNPLRVALFSI